MQEYGNKRINSLDFHRVEDWLAVAGDDDSLHLYNTQSGTQHKLLHSKKYGLGQIRFTHAPDAILHASTRVRFSSLDAVIDLLSCSSLYVLLSVQGVPVLNSDNAGDAPYSPDWHSGRGMITTCGTYQCTRTTICDTSGATPSASLHCQCHQYPTCSCLQPW